MMLFVRYGIVDSRGSYVDLEIPFGCVEKEVSAMEETLLFQLIFVIESFIISRSLLARASSNICRAFWRWSSVAFEPDRGRLQDCGTVRPLRPTDLVGLMASA
jgi:hypothetical protein